MIVGVGRAGALTITTVTLETLYYLHPIGHMGMGWDGHGDVVYSRTHIIRSISHFVIIEACDANFQCMCSVLP